MILMNRLRIMMASFPLIITENVITSITNLALLVGIAAALHLLCLIKFLILSLLWVA